MKVYIEKVHNGYILEHYDDESRKYSRVLYQDNEDPTNKDNFLFMVGDLIDIFGEYKSKHDLRRIALGYYVGDNHTIKDAKQGVEFSILKGEDE